MRLRPKHLLVVAILAVAACGGGGSDSPTTPGNTGGNNNPGGNPGGAPSSTNAVTVANNNFSPANVQVSVGTTVTWTWSQDAITHNVTFVDGTQSGDKGAGSTFSRTFSTAGTFNYSCTIHPGMNGSVLVQ
jgi:plastocyanin